MVLICECGNTDFSVTKSAPGTQVLGMATPDGGLPGRYCSSDQWHDKSIAEAHRIDFVCGHCQSAKLVSIPLPEKRLRPQFFYHCGNCGEDCAEQVAKLMASLASSGTVGSSDSSL